VPAAHVDGEAGDAEEGGSGDGRQDRRRAPLVFVQLAQRPARGVAEKRVWAVRAGGRGRSLLPVRLAFVLQGIAIMPTVAYFPSRGKCRHGEGMARTNPLGVRVEPEIKEALERAAADDDRSVSSLVERFLREALIARGYLPKPGTAPKAKPRTKKPGGSA
jgi:hypothetical protein